MYSGAGSASLLAAAAAWDGLAMELSRAAASYQSAVTALVSEEWLGPTSSSMAAAVTPYTGWMSTTGAQAEQAASQATAAASAYETAFAMTVPPAEVMANRTQLALLIATNFLGLNTAAIAANEAEYSEMWAQDAAAMYGYAASSAGASRLTSFSQAPQTTNPDSQNDQASAVAQATGTSTATGAQETLSQLTSSVPNALQSLASPVSSSSSSSLLSSSAATSLTSGSLWDFLDSNFVNGIVSGGYINPAIVEPAVTASMADVNAVQLAAQPSTQAIPPMGSGSGNAGWTPVPGATGATMGGPPLGPIGVPSTESGWISAGTNQASTIGRLSVPQTWTVAAQVENHAGAALPGGGWSSTSTPAPEPPAAAGAPGMPGIPAGNSGGRSFGTGPRYGFQVTVMPRPPAAG
jgi:PPE-repeat protein